MLCPKTPNYLFFAGNACRAGIRRALEMDPDLDFETYEGDRGKIGYRKELIPQGVMDQIYEERR